MPELRNQIFPAMISTFVKLISYSSDNVLPPLFITWVTPLNFLYIFGRSHRLSIRYLFRNLFLSAKNALTLTQFLGEISYVCVIPQLPLGRAISLQIVKSEYQPLFPILCIPWLSYKGHLYNYVLEHSRFHFCVLMLCWFFPLSSALLARFPCSLPSFHS